MFIPKGYKRVLICITGRVPFQSPVGFALIHGSCQNTCLLLGNLQKVDLRHSNFRSFRRSEVGIGEKKRMTAVSFTKSSDFFTPQICEKRFLNIRFELSLRPYSYSAESSAFQVTPRESPETSKNPPDDTMCKTIMVATSCDTQFVRI